MELDDLQEMWRGYDARLDASLALNERLLRRASLGGTQTALGRLALGVRIELAADAIALLFIGGFAADHVREPGPFAAAAVLGVATLALVIALATALVAIGRIDFDAPVVAIAGSLDRLRLLRAWTVFATLAVSPLLWTPLLIVALRAFAGVDAIAAFGLPYVAANLAVGVALLAVASLVARRAGANPHAPSPYRRLLDVLAGYEVRAARKQVDALARYVAHDA